MAGQVVMVLALLVLAALAAATKVEVKELRQMEMTGMHDDEDDDAELDVLREMSRPREERALGINLLTENGDILISDPSHKLLRKILKMQQAPNDPDNALFLDKVRKMTQKEMMEERRAARKAAYSLDHLNDMMASERRQAQEYQDDSIINRLYDWIW